MIVVSWHSPLPMFTDVWPQRPLVSVVTGGGDMAGVAQSALPCSAQCWCLLGLSPHWRVELRVVSAVTSNNTWLSAATTDNSSRVMWQQHNNSSNKVRPDTEHHGVASDEDVVRHKNSSSNIPQLISRHIAHPTFLILRSLAATVARAAGIFKRLRLGLNTHYTEMLYSLTVFLSNRLIWCQSERGVLTNIFAYKFDFMSERQNTFSPKLSGISSVSMFWSCQCGPGLWLITTGGSVP